MNKIVFVTRSMWAGGAERIIAQLVKYMSNDDDIECTIITMDDDKVLYDIPNEVRIIPIGKKSDNQIIDKIKRYKSLRRIVKKEDPDIVLSLPEDIGIYVILALLGINVPVVVSERNNPWVMPWKKESRILRKLMYPFAKGLIFQTEEAASFFSKGIRKKGIVLTNPLDLERIPKPYEGERNKEVIGAGRLDSQKNFSMLINAFSIFQKKHSEYVLKIYGEGKLKEELEELAQKTLMPDTYYFMGRSSNLLIDIQKSTMFVLSSDYEGMPNVVIEAMAIGLPVISTDCPSGGSAYLITNEENGLLVEVGDVLALGNAMCRIAEDEALRSKLSKNAEKIKIKLDASKVVDMWREYLESLI